MLDISIIIVSYNTADILRECLTSLYRTAGATFEVFVVDNASPDGSADIVGKEFPQVQLIRSPVNGGYAYANNLALKEIGIADAQTDAAGPKRSRYVLLLNPDTVLTVDALSGMVAFMDDNPDIGISGPKLLRADGSLDLACRRSFPTPKIALYRMLGLSALFPKSPRFARYNLTYLDPDETTEVDSVVGAFMMLRWEALGSAGLLDESFFMYGEDLDLALRIKALGWKVVYYPKVTVLHYKGESSRTHKPRAVFEFYRSMLIFYRKHYSSTTPRPLGWLIVSAICVRGLSVYLWNLAGYRLLLARTNRT
ncbi:MAG: glycosyltransferase family 2 protein [Dehalococcoidia bacterium]|nr:glycosyltransferase family 2 protein [Dehalococcoidia bacterium]